MSKTPTQSITSGLKGTFTAPIGEVAQRVRRALTKDGWRVVRVGKLQRLESVLNEIYVDNRRNRQVELLEEARKIVTSL